MLSNYILKKKYLFLFLILFTWFSKDIFSQNIDSSIYPKVDIHLGISGILASYIGSICQLSNNISFELSYGNIFFPIDPLHGFGSGINYHFHYFILNFTYVHLERNLYFSHIISLNIELFSIDDPGFHWIGAIGGFYEVGKYYSNNPKEAGLNFNFALGFTII